MYDLTGDDNPQAQQFQQGGFGGGFPGGGFGGINIEDLMRQGFFGGGGFPGGHQQQGHPGGQRRQQQQQQQGRQYTFSFGGGEGVRFEF